MSRQYDSVRIGDDGEDVAIFCLCSEPAHGLLRIFKSRYCDPHEAEFTIAFASCPNSHGLKDRLRNAWGVFWGQPVECNLEISGEDAKKVAGWLSGEEERRDNDTSTSSPGTTHLEKLAAKARDEYQNGRTEPL